MDFIREHYNIEKYQSIIDQYGYISAAKIISESMDKDIDNAYVAGTLYALALQEQALDVRTLYKERPYMFNGFVDRFIIDHYESLAASIDHQRDYGYQFASVKKLAKNYLFKMNGEPVESIQWAWMRIAVQVAAPLTWTEDVDLTEVIETYHIMSRREGIHATPTCINSGSVISQLESCFCVRIDDTMLSIADVQKLLMMGSKCNGGFGVFMGDIRHSRVANRGITKGVPGLAKVINALVPYADQLGSRPMAVSLYLPVWHCDITVFIKMKDANSPLDIRATLLNYAVCIPDLFKRRCLEGGDWSLFCPRECKIQWVRVNGGDPNNTHDVDKAPSLCDVWGKEFEAYYLMCERSGIARQTIKASDLNDQINISRATIGGPYLFYTDNVNRKSNQMNIGTIVQSNLCTEITQVTTTDTSLHGEMVATCDLATINLASLVREGESPSFDWKRLGEITRQLTRNLNRVIDRTSGILPNEGERLIDELLAQGDCSDSLRILASQMKRHIQKDPTYNGRSKMRAIGIGVMGMASAFSLMEYPYGSKEAINLGVRIRACIYWHSLDESTNLAERDGSYPLFNGSPLSKGILSHDLWNQESIEMKDVISQMNITDDIKRYTWKDIDPMSFGIDLTWDYLRDKVKRGVRNSLLTCQMPNATTSVIMGVSPSIEPFYSMCYTSDDINGKDTSLYDALVTIFKRYHLYDPEMIASHLYTNKGSITDIHKLFDDPLQQIKARRLETLFLDCNQINKKKYLLFIQRMGHYVDQAQSMNIFFAKPNVGYISRLSTLAWMNGAKTEYYVRREADTQRINPLMEESGAVCQRDNPDCVSCQ